MSTAPSLTRTFVLQNEAETLALGAALAGITQRGEVIALAGPLGAGKTTLARGFIRKLTGSDEEVVSPTFTLVQTYDSPRATIWHFDLYRLNTADEALELGLEDALATGITLIEWPERLGSLLPRRRLTVTLTGSSQGRTAELKGPGWAERLTALKLWR